MEILAEGLSRAAAYRLLIGSVVPRPIAWVSTLSSAGLVNIAPFSAFTLVTYTPPRIALCIGRRRGVIKDTMRNITHNKQFVVNIGNEENLEQIHKSSAEFPSDVSEASALELELVPSRILKVPRIASAPINIECMVDRIEAFEEGTNLVVGQVMVFHIDDNLYRGGKIDSAKLRPIARLGGPFYAKLGDIIEMTPVRMGPDSE